MSKIPDHLRMPPAGGRPENQPIPRLQERLLALQTKFRTRKALREALGASSSSFYDWTRGMRHPPAWVDAKLTELGAP